MSILGAIGGLVGSLFSSKAAKDTNRQNILAQENAAKKQIRWRVADAKAAGVGTLAALGMNPISISPSQVSGPDFSEAGQGLGRALETQMTSRQKQDDFTRSMQRLQLERGALENEVLRSRLASEIRLARQPAQPPSMASAAGPLDQGIAPRDLDVAGVTHNMSPGWSKAQDVEDEYSDVVGNVYGVAKLLADLNYNYGHYIPTDAQLLQLLKRKFKSGYDHHHARLLLKRMPRNFHP